MATYNEPGVTYNAPGVAYDGTGAGGSSSGASCDCCQPGSSGLVLRTPPCGPLAPFDLPDIVYAEHTGNTGSGCSSLTIGTVYPMPFYEELEVSPGVFRWTYMLDTWAACVPSTCRYLLYHVQVNTNTQVFQQHFRSNDDLYSDIFSTSSCNSGTAQPTNGESCSSFVPDAHLFYRIDALGQFGAGPSCGCVGAGAANLQLRDTP